MEQPIYRAGDLMLKGEAKVLYVTAGALLSLAAPVAAQICGGFPSFASGRFQVSATAQFNDQAKVFGAGLALGGRGPYGQVGIATTSYDDFDGSTLSLAGSGGYQVSLDQKGVFHLCPTISYVHGSGPDDVDFFGDGSLIIDFSQTDLAFGVSVGAMPAQEGSARVIPSASFSIVSTSIKGTDDVSGVSDTQSETFQILGLGLGIVFNENVALRPGVSIPIGLDGGSTTAGLIVSVNFGRR